MDLDRLAALVWVIDLGSFTKAAERLGIPKSTVSRRVSSLEDDLGVRLLHRSTRKVTATEAGRALHARAARAIAELEDAVRAVEDLGDVPRGELRITAPVDFGVAVLADLSKEFLDLHPEVSLTLELTNRLVDLVGEGFDAALRFGSLADSSLVARRLATSTMGFFASREYLAARGAPASLDDLDDHELLVFKGAAGASPVDVVTPSGPTTREIRGRLACNDFSFLRRAALASCGVGLLPLLIVDERECRGRLVRVLPDHFVPSGDLHFVYPSARHLSANVRAFRDFLVERLAR
jgi:DNA-binding transcriptional LysR family regulator